MDLDEAKSFECILERNGGPRYPKNYLTKYKFKRAQKKRREGDSNIITLKSVEKSMFLVFIVGKF